MIQYTINCRALNCFLRLLTVQENELGIREKKVNWFLGNSQTDSFIKGHKDFQNSSDYSECLANFNYFRLIYLTFPRNREMFNLGCFIAYFMFKHWTQKQLFALLIDPPRFSRGAFLADLPALRWPISCASEANIPSDSISFKMRARDRTSTSWDANRELTSSHPSCFSLYLPPSPIFILVHLSSLHLSKLLNSFSLWGKNKI